MPIRKTPLVTKEIYHIINRGVASQPIFLEKRDYDRFLSTLFYYLNPSHFIPFSRLHRFPNRTHPNSPLVEILAYCFMPNHIHLLLKQKKENGISTFMSIFQNSYVRYFNTKYNRLGPLFQGRFKAVLVETDEQLLHVSRYIHLNPYSSYIVKSKEEILTYPYSSIEQYLNPKLTTQIYTKEILSHFSKNQTYKDFLLDQADYQRALDQIKHLILETQ